MKYDMALAGAIAGWVLGALVVFALGCISLLLGWDVSGVLDDATFWVVVPGFMGAPLAPISWSCGTVARGLTAWAGATACLTGAGFAVYTWV